MANDDVIERNPKDTYPFRIDQGLTTRPAWVVRLEVNGYWVIVYRGESFEDCVATIAPYFLTERKLAAELRASRARVAAFEELLGYMREPIEAARKSLPLRVAGQPRNVDIHWHTSEESLDLYDAAMAGEDGLEKGGE